MQPHVRSVLGRCVQSIALAVNAGGFLESAQRAIRRVRRHLTKTHLTMMTNLWRWSWQMGRRKPPILTNTRLSHTNCAASLMSRKISAYPPRTILNSMNDIPCTKWSTHLWDIGSSLTGKVEKGSERPPSRVLRGCWKRLSDPVGQATEEDLFQYARKKCRSGLPSSLWWRWNACLSHQSFLSQGWFDGSQAGLAGNLVGSGGLSISETGEARKSVLEAPLKCPHDPQSQVSVDRQGYRRVAGASALRRRVRGQIPSSLHIHRNQRAKQRRHQAQVDKVEQAEAADQSCA